MIPKPPALEKAAANSIEFNLANAAIISGNLVFVILVILVFQIIAFTQLVGKNIYNPKNFFALSPKIAFLKPSEISKSYTAGRILFQ